MNALIAWMVTTFTAAGRPPAEDVSGPYRSLEKCEDARVSSSAGVIRGSS